jgi:hypothetical protein
VQRNSAASKTASGFNQPFDFSKKILRVMSPKKRILSGIPNKQAQRFQEKLSGYECLITYAFFGSISYAFLGDDSESATSDGSFALGETRDSNRAM